LKASVTKPKSPASPAPPARSLFASARTRGETSLTATPFSPPAIQAKFTVNEPGDEYEHEADRIAAEVTQSRSGGTASKPSNGRDHTTPKNGLLIQRVLPPEPAPLQRQPEDKEEQPEETRKEEDEEEERIQKKGLPGSSPKLTPKIFHRLKNLFGRGRPLPEVERKYFEPRFGHDFSKVRVHNDPESAEIAHDLHAQAFTHGHDIFFGVGQYRPDTSEGRFLIAHELTHVVQQRMEEMPVARENSPFEYKLSRADEGFEMEAEQAAHHVLNGRLQSLLMRWLPATEPQNLIARRMSNYIIPALNPDLQVSPEIIESITTWVIENLQAITPEARARIAGRLNSLTPLIRDKVLDELQKRLSPEQNETLNELWTEREATQEETQPLPNKQTTTEAAHEEALPAPSPEISNSTITPAQTIAAPPPPEPEAKTALPTVAAEAETETAKAAVAPQAGTETPQTPAVQPGTKAPQRLAAQPADGEAPAAEAKEEKSPASPEEDPAFQDVVEKAKSTGARQRSHAPAKVKSAEAQNAAESPKEEISGRASERQVQIIDQQEPKPFNREAFKTALLKKIAEITPKTLKEADEFKEKGKVDSIKGDLSNEVGESKKQAQGGIPEKVAEKPPENDIKPKETAPIPPTQAGPAPGDIGAAQAAPKPKTDSETSLQAGSKELDDQMSAADVTEEQLQKSNEPEFQAALESKKTAQVDAAEAPQAYRAEEQTTLATAQKGSRAEAQTELKGMNAERGKAFTQVLQQQGETKTQDEQKRTEIFAAVQGFYDKTKKNVEDRLKRLDEDVNRTFDQGAAAARQIFEDHVERRMDAYKDDRYGLPWGPGRWIKDKFAGLPDEVNEFYKEGKDLYLQKMDQVIDDIATLVETGLNEAKDEIAKGKQEIQDYVNGLPLALKGIGNEAAESIQDKFEELEQSVLDKQNELIDSLAQKYAENLKALDARINEMKEANRGLVDKAIGAIKAVIEAIINLKNLLLNVLAKVAQVIGLIIRDPIGFLGNLVSAVKQGFQNFIAKIGTYLQQGLIGWLVGAVAQAGIEIPEHFDVKGILSLVMQILQVTYSAIRKRAVELLGEGIVSKLEQVADIFKVIITEGPAGLWQYIKDMIGDLKSLVFDQIMTFVRERIIMAGVTWILSLLNPASAFIKACKAIYDIVIFFIERGRQILELINAILDSIAAIATGALDKAAQLVENALAKAVPVVISFLAALLGLGGISEKVKGIIERVRKPISKAIDWVINKAMNLAKAAGKLLGIGKKEEKTEKPEKATETKDPEHDLKVQKGLAAIDEEEKKYLEDGKISRENAEKVAATIKKQHPIFKSITVADGRKIWNYKYKASEGEKPGEEKTEGEDKIRVTFSASRHLLKGIIKSNAPIKSDNTVILDEFDLKIVEQATRDAYTASSGKGRGEFTSESINWVYEIKGPKTGERFLHIFPTHSPPKAIYLNRQEAKAVQNFQNMRNSGKTHTEAMALSEANAKKVPETYSLSDNALLIIGRLT